MHKFILSAGIGAALLLLVPAAWAQQADKADPRRAELEKKLDRMLQEMQDLRRDLARDKPEPAAKSGPANDGPGTSRFAQSDGPRGSFGFPNWDSRFGSYDRSRREEDSKDKKPADAGRDARSMGSFGGFDFARMSPDDMKKMMERFGGSSDRRADDRSADRRDAGREPPRGSSARSGDSSRPPWAQWMGGDRGGMDRWRSGGRSDGGDWRRIGSMSGGGSRGGFASSRRYGPGSSWRGFGSFGRSSRGGPSWRGFGATGFGSGGFGHGGSAWGGFGRGGSACGNFGRGGSGFGGMDRWRGFGSFGRSSRGGPSWSGFGRGGSAWGGFGRGGSSAGGWGRAGDHGFDWQRMMESYMRDFRDRRPADRDFRRPGPSGGSARPSDAERKLERLLQEVEDLRRDLRRR